MRTAVAIIGGGQSGLAMSRCLTDRGIDHVVLERGEVANSWKTERWDSLRLLTPNWMTRLPGYHYDGADPDGYMTAFEVGRVIDAYSRSFDAPVLAHTTVTDVRRTSGGFMVHTDRRPIEAQAVVIASGAHGLPVTPRISAAVPLNVSQLHTIRYRRPEQVKAGGVLVIGASASGVQIGDELQRDGRQVTIAVGDHVRMPRMYRGRDIHWWMDAAGLLGERYTEVEDLNRARRLPSAQLAGTPERRSLGLRELQEAGVRLVGRLAGATASEAQFSGSLVNFVRSGDLKQNRLLDRIDEFIDESGLADEVPEPGRPAPTPVVAGPNSLAWSEFDTIIWATGYRPDYRWLDPALVDRRGHIPHDGGVMGEPGMYVLGLPFLRRRSSSFIAGLEWDAVELADHVAAHLANRARAA
jgi:putative flavoprotein involved in K+ transport